MKWDSFQQTLRTIFLWLGHLWVLGYMGQTCIMCHFFFERTPRAPSFFWIKRSFKVLTKNSPFFSRHHNLLNFCFEGWKALKASIYNIVVPIWRYAIFQTMLCYLLVLGLFNFKNFKNPIFVLPSSQNHWFQFLNIIKILKDLNFGFSKNVKELVISWKNWRCFHG